MYTIKYYSVSLDYNPAISNMEQLTLPLHHVLRAGPVERFVASLDMEGHNAEQLTQILLNC